MSQAEPPFPPTRPIIQTHLLLELRDERGSDEAGPDDADANGGVG